MSCKRTDLSDCADITDYKRIHNKFKKIIAKQPGITYTIVYQNKSVYGGFLWKKQKFQKPRS